MTDPIQGGKVPRQLQETYKQEFARGAQLFQESLNQYETADSDNKKAAFKNVMDECLDAMNKAAQGFLSPQNKDMEHLHQDYEAFLEKDNPETFKKLNSDLSQLKKMH